MIPYVYRVRHKITKKFYYGVKYSKDADPNLFWIKYFTSSKRIWNLIESYGKDSFDIKILKTFDNREDALLYETKLIKRTFRSKLSLNFRHSENYTGVDKESSQKMVKTRKRNGSYKTGSIKRKATILKRGGFDKIGYKSAETKRSNGFFEKLSEDMKGKQIGQEHICEYCGKISSSGNYKRWHGDNCKHNPNITQEQIDKRKPWNKGKKKNDKK